MPDESVVNALKRFCSRAEVESIYKQAFAAFQERAIEVVIVSSSLAGGGSSSGEMKYDPRELMDACEEVLQGMDAEDSGTAVVTGAVSTDFSRRVLGT